MTANILIVDDELDMLALLAMIVSEKTDHKVTTTTNPLEVVQFVKEGDFDLVISDLKMPGMNGIELASEIRKIDKNIPVLVVTAYASIESAEEAVSQGVYDYIPKPFRKEQILIAINRALEWKNMKSELEKLKGQGREG